MALNSIFVQGVKDTWVLPINSDGFILKGNCSVTSKGQKGSTVRKIEDCGYSDKWLRGVVTNILGQGLWRIMWIDLQILQYLFIPKINHTELWWMIILMYCWIRLANTLLRFLHLYSSRILGDRYIDICISFDQVRTLCLLFFSKVFLWFFAGNIFFSLCLSLSIESFYWFLSTR